MNPLLNKEPVKRAEKSIKTFDPNLEIDEVYNYGTFDGFEENFELKFAKGQLDYSLSKQSLNGFLYEYQYYITNREEWKTTINEFFNSIRTSLTDAKEDDW